MDRIPEWVVPALLLPLAGLIAIWMAGAIYYDACRSRTWGRSVAAAWLAAVVALFALWSPVWKPFVALAGAASIFLVWWLRLRPSHDGDWDPSVAVLPRAVRRDDSLTLENVRNFEYRSLEDFTPRYETRTVRLSSLQGADIIIFNWGSRWMSHPVLVFDFGPDGRVCISIEVRYRKGQDFAILRSLYRQQELIFMVADERDVILRRTKYGPEQSAWLYRLRVSPERLRSAFLDYAGAINDLHDNPRWYHGLCANCTTTFYRLPNSRLILDWRVLANRHIDRALYEGGQLDRSLPFEQLQRLARINEIANAAPEAGFGEHLRRELEKRRHER
jgi:hypothetical protein